MDEYEFSFADRSQAEVVLATLQEMLIGFQLRLNPRKTKIEQSHVPIEQEWVHEIRAFEFPTRSAHWRSALLRYFDQVGQYARSLQQEHTVAFALGRLRNVSVPMKHSQLFQSLMSEAVTSEPSVVRTYLEILIRCDAKGHRIDKTLLESTLNQLIETSGPLGYDFEVVWSLWGLLSFGLPIHSPAVEIISRAESSLIALLALDAARRGLTAIAPNEGLWAARMLDEELYQDQWLLAYEANIKGWLPSLRNKDHVAADQNFKFLKNAGVRFYFPPMKPVPLAPPWVSYP